MTWTARTKRMARAIGTAVIAAAVLIPVGAPATVAIDGTSCEELPGHGALRVFLDGMPLKCVNLSRSEPQTRQIIGIAEFSRPRAGRVRVAVKSRGKPVRIEGLGIETR